ncbi:MAG: LPS assembly lipoprotein LptE [Arenicellales bacterium]|nr:LPS assembly lipoprotein LptE [Arenicellales bacterium]
MPKPYNYTVICRDNGCRAVLSWVRSGRNVVILLASAMLIAGCGFHLRGKVQLPAVFSATHVKGTDLSLVDDIKRALRVAGGAVVNEKAEATVSIELLRVTYSRAVRSINEQGIAVSYELQYDVRYRVSGQAKQRLVPDARIALKRTLDYGDKNMQILQKAIEENLLKQEMRDEIVRQVISRLASVKVGLMADRRPRSA